MSSSVQNQPLKDRRGRSYAPAIGPKLRPLLWILLGGFALLGANGFYLASITAVTWATGGIHQTYFSTMMIVLHLVLGFAIVLPVIIFGFAHLATSWKRPNKSAIRYGLALLVCSLVVLVSGLLLVQLFGVYEVRDPRVRSVSYWLHVITPLLVVGLYVKHRLAGPRIRWVYARRLGAAVAVGVLAMGVLHSQEPRRFGVKGPREGSKYFFPSEAVTASGNFIPAKTLMMDNYCLKCHQDAYKGWYHSSHHFSSFNNKAYLSSVRETRKVSIERDGSPRGARWCAGCHDPVPFFSGEFDDPNYDDVNNPTSQAGITCTVCHSITNVNSTRGNADYTILERESGSLLDQPDLGESQARDAQADVSQTRAPGFKILLDLPQGWPALRREPLQGFPPRSKPLRYVSPFRRLRSWRSEFLLSAGRQRPVHQLPHEFHPLERLRGEGFRRQRGANRPRPLFSRREHRPGHDPRRESGR
jgi:hypothetical protein